MALSTMRIYPARLQKIRTIRDHSRSYARQLEASAAFNMAMRRAETRPQALEILLDHSLQAFCADAAGVYDLRDGYLIYTAGRGLDELPPDQVPAGSSSVLCQAMYADRVLRFDTSASADDDCDICAFLAQQGMHCLLLTPLRSGEQVVGVLFLALRALISLSLNDVQLVNAFSEAAGNTLQRLQLLEQLEHTVANREKELQLLYDLMTIAGETSEMDQLLQKSLQRILQATGGQMGVLHFASPPDQRLKYRMGEGYSREFDDYLTISGLSEQLWTRVYQNQKAVRADGLPDRSDPEIPNPERRTYTYLGVPIQVKGKTVGVLSLFNLSEQPLNPMVLQMLSSAAEELGPAVENTHLRKQAEDAVLLHERQRLSRNLHDSVSQSLYALVISADVSEKLLRIKDFPRLRQELKDISKVALQGLKEMRLLLYEFRPPSLEDLGLVKALELRLNTVECRAGIDASLKVEGSINLSPQMEMEIYQIAIEGLNNSLKHAEAGAVSVVLSKDADQLSLEIQDDGIGFPTEAAEPSGGLGLDSMRERARILGGSLTIRSYPGQGTRIRLVAPLTRAVYTKEENATPIDTRFGG